MASAVRDVRRMAASIAASIGCGFVAIGRKAPCER